MRTPWIAPAVTLLVLINIISCASAPKPYLVSQNPPLQFSGNAVGYTLKKMVIEGQSIPFNLWYPSDSEQKKFFYDFGGSVDSARDKVATQLAVDGKVKNGSFPLIALSHGATGCGIGLAFYAEQFVRAGFVVVAPDYPDEVVACTSDPADYPLPRSRDAALRKLKTLKFLRYLAGAGLNPQNPEDRFKAREKFGYRPKILRQAVQTLLNEKQTWHIDSSKIGLAGHSFGAWTSLLVGGLEQNRTFGHLVAAIAYISGPVRGYPFLPSEIAGIDKPLFFIFGSSEIEPSGQQPKRRDQSLFFDSAKKQKYLTEIINTSHFSFSTGVRHQYESIAEYLSNDPARLVTAQLLTDFFMAHLTGNATSLQALQKKRAGVADYLF